MTTCTRVVVVLGFVCLLSLSVVASSSKKVSAATASIQIAVADVLYEHADYRAAMHTYMAATDCEDAALRDPRAGGHGPLGPAHRGMGRGREPPRVARPDERQRRPHPHARRRRPLGQRPVRRGGAGLPGRGQRGSGQFARPPGRRQVDGVAEPARVGAGRGPGGAPLGACRFRHPVRGRVDPGTDAPLPGGGIGLLALSRHPQGRGPGTIACNGRATTSPSCGRSTASCRSRWSRRGTSSSTSSTSA